MSSVIDTIERAQLRRVPDFAPGDRVKVHFQVIEGSRRRVQVFEGVVIKRQGHGARETFTVRKQSFGVGVERMFPVHSPKIERIELAARGDVRRAKLYYLRDRVGKRARVRERRYTGPEQEVEPGLLHEQASGATDAEGMTAEEALQVEPAQAGADAQTAETVQADGGNASSEDASRGSTSSEDVSSEDVSSGSTSSSSGDDAPSKKAQADAGASAGGGAEDETEAEAEAVDSSGADGSETEGSQADDSDSDSATAESPAAGADSPSDAGETQERQGAGEQPA